MKKILALVLSTTLILSTMLMAGCAAKTPAADPAAAVTEPAAVDPAAPEAEPAAAPTGDFQIGITFSDLTNPVWAELVKEAEKYGKEKGVKVTYVDAQNDPSKQVTQIENFVQSGMNAIIICSVDSSTLIDATKKAQDAGVAVVAYTQGIEGSDSEYMLDAYATGELCGETAAKWIIEKFGPDAEVEWGLMDLPRYPEIIIRADGIKAGLAKGAPKAKLVATASALTVEDGVKNAENFLQANPNMQIIACIGGGGGTGANEGVKSMNKVTPEFGVFSIDATEQEVLNIITGTDPQRASISLGGGKEHGRKLVDIALSILNKEAFEKTYYMPAKVIDKSNAQAYYDEVYKK